VFVYVVTVVLVWFIVLYGVQFLGFWMLTEFVHVYGML
jgi:hypothetical protein